MSVGILFKLFNKALPKISSFTKLKKVLRALGIAQVTIGIMSCTMGLLLIIDSKNPRYVRTESFYFDQVTYTHHGEGLWCGFWILASGILGVICGKKTINPCLVNNLLGFSIATAIFSLVMLGLGGLYAYAYSRVDYTLGLVIEIFLAIFGFFEFFLSYASAKYCLQITKAAGLKGICGGSCGKEPMTPKDDDNNDADNSGQGQQRQTNGFQTPQQQVVTTAPLHKTSGFLPQPPASQNAHQPGFQQQQSTLQPGLQNQQQTLAMPNSPQLNPPSPSHGFGQPPPSPTHHAHPGTQQPLPSPNYLNPGVPSGFKQPPPSPTHNPHPPPKYPKPDLKQPPPSPNYPKPGVHQPPSLPQQYDEPVYANEGNPPPYRN